MSKEERLLKFKNELNFGIETKDGTFYVPKDDVITIVSDLIDEVSQPQLTISKSVADIIDGYCKYDLTADKLIMMAYRDYQEFHDWLKKDWLKNDNIAKAYLAGKALGVDLVKVVEG